MYVTTVKQKSDANTNMQRCGKSKKEVTTATGLCVSPAWIRFPLPCGPFSYTHTHQDTHHMHEKSNMDGNSAVLFLSIISKTSEVENVIPVSCTFSSTVTVLVSALHQIASSMFGQMTYICCVPSTGHCWTPNTHNCILPFVLSSYIRSPIFLQLYSRLDLIFWLIL